MTVEERRRRRFTPEFRKEQVKLIESGQMTIKEVSLLYEVRAENVRRWLKKYGTKELAPLIIISSSSEVSRLQDLEKENRKLKELIGSQHVELVYKSELLKLAKEKLGEDFEKK